jgi:hypothetical protein
MMATEILQQDQELPAADMMTKLGAELVGKLLHNTVCQGVGHFQDMFVDAYIPLLTRLIRVCPLAAVTGKHPAVCRAMESLIAELLDVPVSECCDRSERPKCCFEIAATDSARIPT